MFGWAGFAIRCYIITAGVKSVGLLPEITNENSNFQLLYTSAQSSPNKIYKGPINIQNATLTGLL